MFSKWSWGSNNSKDFLKEELGRSVGEEVRRGGFTVESYKFDLVIKALALKKIRGKCIIFFPQKSQF